MAFEDELAALLEANTVFQPQGIPTDSGLDFSGSPTYDPGFESGAFGGFVIDTETGEVITIAEAMRRDPGAFSRSDILRDRSAGFSSPSVASAEPSRDTGSILGMIRSNKDLIGLALTGGAAALGLGSAIAGMVRSADGGGTLTLPNGRTLTLSPQETELLDLAVRQAKAQANISDKALGAVSKAVDVAAPDITNTLTAGARTAATQAAAQGQMADVSRSALFDDPGAAGLSIAERAQRVLDAGGGGLVGEQRELLERAASGQSRGMDDSNALAALLPGVEGKLFSAASNLVRTDLANEKTLQGAQGKAAVNLGDLLDVDPTEEQVLGARVGKAADTEALRLAEGGPLDPAFEALRPTGEAARQTVTNYISGITDLPDLYGDENEIRTTANARLKAGLTSDQIANPAIARQIRERYEQLQAQMLRDAGPGWEMSTPGQRALREFEDWKAELTYGSNLADTQAMSSLALPRAQFLEGVQSGRAGAAAPLVTGIPNLLNTTRMSNLSTYAGIGTSARAFEEGRKQNVFARNASVAGDIGRGTNAVARVHAAGQVGAPTPAGAMSTMLGQNPGNLALGAMGNLSTIANFQEGTANQNAITNALLEAQRKRDLLTGGGQLIGQAVSPFISAAAKSFF